MHHISAEVARGIVALPDYYTKTLINPFPYMLFWLFIQQVNGLIKAASFEGHNFKTGKLLFAGYWSKTVRF